MNICRGESEEASRVGFGVGEMVVDGGGHGFKNEGRRWTPSYSQKEKRKRKKDEDTWCWVGEFPLAFSVILSYLSSLNHLKPPTTPSFLKLSSTFYVTLEGSTPDYTSVV